MNHPPDDSQGIKKQRINAPWLGAALVYLVMLLVATHLPQDKLPVDVNRFGVDKLIHLCVYALLAGLFRKALIGQRSIVWSVVFVLVMVIAVLDETTQTYFNRQFDWLDLVADLIGVLGCWWIDISGLAKKWQSLVKSSN